MVRGALLLIGFLYAMTLGGCSSSSDAPPAAAPAADVATRFIHAAPSAGAVDIWLDGKVLHPNVSFTGLKAYVNLTGGVHTVKVVETARTQPVLLEEQITVARGKSYTVIIREGSLELSLFEDDRTTAPDAATVRFIHLVKGLFNVDAALILGQQSTVVEDIPFNGAGGPVNVPGGTYQLEFRASGPGDVLVTYTGLELEDGMTYTIHAAGLADEDDMVQIFITRDAPGDGSVKEDLVPAGARVRLAHVAFEAPNFASIQIDGEEIIQGFSYRTVTSYDDTGARTYQVQAFRSFGDQQPAIESKETLAPDTPHTLAFLGDPGVEGDEALRVKLYADNGEPDAGGMAQVRFINAMAGLEGNLDVLIAGREGALAENLEFAGATAYEKLSPGDHDFQLKRSGGGAEVLTKQISLEGGKNYTLFGIGLPAEILAVIDTPPAGGNP